MKLHLMIAMLGAGLMLGCSGRPSILPNSDPELRKNMAQLSADAVKRHPFKTELPRGGEALARASVDYTFKTVQVLNYSDVDWEDVEIWVNRSYVVSVPKLPHGKDGAKTIDFQMLFDDKGEFFWTDHGKVRIEQLEMLRDGKIYSIKLTPAD